MKRCCDCKRTKPLGAFHANASNVDGLHDSCCECKNARRRARSPEAKRDERQKWKRDNREKYLAHKAVHKAVVRGTLVRPERCEGCGAPADVQAHHEDYAQRFDVVWLCPRCHGQEHAGWNWPAAA